MKGIRINMKKSLMVLFSLGILILISGSVYAESTIWQFDNFVNKYRVYGESVCNVDKNKPCVSELGWQGDTMSFKFNLDDGAITSEYVTFQFSIDYFSPIKLNVYAGKPAKKITQLEMNHDGTYSVSIPSSYFIEGKKNTIKLASPNVRVGYGRPTQGFVIYDARFLNQD